MIIPLAIFSLSEFMILNAKPSLVSILILNTLVFGMNPQEAVEAPRFATESVPDSFYPHVYFPNRVSLEEGFAENMADALKSKGHGEIVQAATCGMGATVSRRDPETGVMSTGGDPRRACYAIGW